MNMTSARPSAVLLRFAGPILLGATLQQVYGFVNTAIVGRHLGVTALAALGIINTFGGLVFGFIMGFAVGFTVCLSNARGRGDEALFHRYWCGSVWMGLGGGLLLCLCMQLGLNKLLLAMETLPAVAKEVTAFCRVFFFGLILAGVNSVITAVLHALGNSRVPVIVASLVSVINIALDWYLVVQKNMGIAGAAIGSVLCQGITFCMLAGYLYKQFPALLPFWRYRPTAKDVRKLLKTSLPMALQSSFTMVGSMFLQRSINLFGESVTAAFAAVSRLDMVATMTHSAMGTATAIFTAQNNGAKRIDRVKQGIRSALLIVFIASALTSIILLFGGRLLLGSFMSASEVDALAYAQYYLYYLAGLLFVLGWISVFRNAVQGLGDGQFPMLCGIIECIMRIALSLTVTKFFGFPQLCMINPLVWIVICTTLGLYYRKKVNVKGGTA